MAYINGSELSVFKEAALIPIDFTDEEYRKLKDVAIQLKTILDAAKKRDEGRITGAVKGPYQIA